MDNVHWTLIDNEKCVSGHKNNEQNVNQLSKINIFFSHVTMSASKMLAGELSLVFHTVKHSVSYYSMDCGNKLTKEICRDSETADKLSCGHTKAEAIKVLFTCYRCVYNNRKMFPVARYFDPCEGIQNKRVNFIEQSDETASSIYKLLKQLVEQNGLDLRKASKYVETAVLSVMETFNAIRTVLD
ncbi:hypothetical protein PR048_029841 [Dryococelus australis]|uniref:Uncharacterized protein n=1 Tax=Dryococelus australis TaxID=614101 RepID=A0ABQ9G795_9NEOP|nr:hypothetical protein PR048_029841 [Dryococelus australis]